MAGNYQGDTYMPLNRSNLLYVVCVDELLNETPNRDAGVWARKWLNLLRMRVMTSPDRIRHPSDLEGPGLQTSGRNTKTYQRFLARWTEKNGVLQRQRALAIMMNDEDAPQEIPPQNLLLDIGVEDDGALAARDDAEVQNMGMQIDDPEDLKSSLDEGWNQNDPEHWPAIATQDSDAGELWISQTQLLNPNFNLVDPDTQESMIEAAVSASLPPEVVDEEAKAPDPRRRLRRKIHRADPPPALTPAQSFRLLVQQSSHLTRSQRTQAAMIVAVCSGKNVFPTAPEIACVLRRSTTGSKKLDGYSYSFHVSYAKYGGMFSCYGAGYKCTDRQFISVCNKKLGVDMVEEVLEHISGWRKVPREEYETDSDEEW